jgi:imidazolonepropionase-like amidohydrolase
MNMRRNVWMWPVISGLLLGLMSAIPGNAQGQALVIEGGTLIDGTGAAPRQNAVIVMEGDRIRAIGTKGQVTYPPNAKVIQADGRYILPGLFECHVHYREWMPQIYLRYGVTTVADTANKTEWIIAQREMLKRGIIKGPRMYVTGRRLGGPLPGRRGGIVPDAIDGTYVVNAATVEEARAEVRRLIAAGVDAIKVHDGLTPEQIRAVVEEARALGEETVVGHQYNARDSAMAGLKYIEHSPPIARATISDPELQRLAAPEYYMEENLYDPLVELFLQQGVYINVPLWTGRRFNPASSTWGWEQLGPQLASDPAFRFVPQHERDSWLPGASGPGNLSSLELERRIAGMQKVKAFLKKYAERGGKFVAGSDAGEEDVPGLWTHYEMQALVDAGLTPMQAIQSATSWPAELFKLEEELGTIQVGRKADAIILTGNPLQNIAETKSVLWVVKDGQVVDTALDPNFKNPLPWTANPDERGPGRGPEIATMAPVMAREGDAEVTVRIGGRDFTPGAVVRFDRSTLQTQFVSDSELVATINRRLLQSHGTFAMTVVNPGSGGGTSNTVYFLVDFRY